METKIIINIYHQLKLKSNLTTLLLIKKKNTLLVNAKNCFMLFGIANLPHWHNLKETNRLDNTLVERAYCQPEDLLFIECLFVLFYLSN